MTYDIENTGEGAHDANSSLHCEPHFLPLLKINTSAATESSIQLEYIKHAITLGYPRFHELEEFSKVKGAENPICLVGGGPSLKSVEIINELYEMYDNGDVIVACGSSHDWLCEQGITPTYTVVCDPDPITLNYLTAKPLGTKYLIATCCHPSIYEHLKGEEIYLWHCHGGDNTDIIKELEGDNAQGLSGGCTVGLRCINISIMLGYTNIHMFGFDSSLGDQNSHHAYEFSDPSKEVIGDIHNIKLGYIQNGIPFEKVYRCSGYHIAQAEQFKDFFCTYSEYFTPTFHGDGLLPDYYKIIINEAKALEANPNPNEDWMI